MKPAYIIISVFLNVAGCRHEVIAPVATGTFIKYKINTTDVQINGDHNDLATIGTGVFCAKQQASQALGIPTTRYVIQGESGPNRLVSFVIISDSLQSSQSYYTSDSTNKGVSVVKHDADRYITNVRPTDRFQINITRYSEGSIDGTFSGTGAQVKTVNGVTTYKDGLITEGSFQKVKILY